MAGFTTDFSEVNDFGGVADGTYEAVVKKAEEGVNKNGKSRINFDLVIRRDVDQKFGGAHIFDEMYPSKETGKYNKGILMTFAKAAGMEDGKSYDDFEDFLNDFVGRPVKVSVANETEEYNGKTYDRLRIRKRAMTSFPTVDLAMNGVTSVNAFAGAKEIELNNDDLPF